MSVTQSWAHRSFEEFRLVAAALGQQRVDLGQDLLGLRRRIGFLILGRLVVADLVLDHPAHGRQDGTVDPGVRVPQAGAHERLGAVQVRFLNCHQDHGRRQLAVNGEAFAQDVVIADLRRTVDAQGLVDAGNEEQQPNGRMFTIGGGTAQILRTVAASKVLDRKLPQTRDGYVGTQETVGKRRGLALAAW
jgi:hypothetical protein